jgi:hypothetical protein
VNTEKLAIRDDGISITGHETKAERLQETADRRERSASPTSSLKNVIKFGIDESYFLGL